MSDVFLMTGKDPSDDQNPVKTFIVVTESEIQARKLLPGHFEVYEIKTCVGDLWGLSGNVGWIGEPRSELSQSAD